MKDETYKVAITVGSRIRVGGTASSRAYPCNCASRARDAGTFGRLPLPKGGDIADAQFWTGLRPMTPDGTPIVGATRFRNMHMNTGHGTLGWTMACGSGRVVADLVSGKRPEIDTADLSIARYA